MKGRFGIKERKLYESLRDPSKGPDSYLKRGIALLGDLLIGTENGPINCNSMGEATGLSVINDKLAELILKCNFVAGADPRITSTNFPVPAIPKLGKTKIYEFGRSVSSEKALQLFAADGFRGPTMAEGLVYTIKNPDYRGPIVLLGEAPVIDGSRRVGVLYRSYSNRILGLFKSDRRWGEDDRFLAVEITS